MYPTADKLVSRFNPTGLVQTSCAHGLSLADAIKAGMPEPANCQRGASYLRSKHLTLVGSGLTAKVKCPVCMGEPAPDDLTTPANR